MVNLAQTILRSTDLCKGLCEINDTAGYYCETWCGKNICKEEDEIWDEDDSNECCDDCGCYHGHHPWCGESDEQEDW